MNIKQIESKFTVPSYHTKEVCAYNVPVELRDEVLDAYRAAGIKIRLRYRGPRVDSIGRLLKCGNTYYKRTPIQAQNTCLKVDATNFTVYER
jgi:hypothetical protein